MPCSLPGARLYPLPGADFGTARAWLPVGWEPREQRPAHGFAGVRRSVGESCRRSPTASTGPLRASKPSARFFAGQ